MEIKFHSYWVKDRRERERKDFIKKKQEEYQKGVQIFVSNNKKDKADDRISILKQNVQNLDWDKKINWNVIKHGLNIQPINIELDPCDDCHPDSNPLYMHKGWMEKIVNDKRLI